MANQTGLNFFFIIWSCVRLATSVVLNFATHVYLPRLTLECQLFKFSFPHLDLPSIANQTHSYPFTWTYLRAPVWLRFWLYHTYLLDQIYNSDAILTRLKPFSGLDHLYLLILKSLALLQQHFLDLYFFLDALHVVPNSTFIFSLPQSCRLSLFHLSSFSAKCRMQMLCLHYADEILWSILPMWYANIVP